MKPVRQTENELKHSKYKVGETYSLNNDLLFNAWSDGTYVVTKIEISHFYDGKAVGKIYFTGLTGNIKGSISSFHLNSQFDMASKRIS